MHPSSSRDCPSFLRPKREIDATASTINRDNTKRQASNGLHCNNYPDADRRSPSENTRVISSRMRQRLTISSRICTTVWKRCSSRKLSKHLMGDGSEGREGNMGEMRQPTMP
uniref:(northern house mosquito) hypothetical protein n=1 Tax=Culex pipiens TaxID=7175 RepID=A0A8D8DGN8_CULPI